jgi:hypothetical protein
MNLDAAKTIVIADPVGTLEKAVERNLFNIRHNPFIAFAGPHSW